MSGPYRNRTWHRESPYEKRSKTGRNVQRDVRQTVNMANELSSSSTSSCSTSASGERGWNYLLRRKAEYINERIQQAKAEACYGGTTEVSSQLVPIKQEPQSPRTSEENYVFALSQMTPQLQAMDASQKYAHYASSARFWIDKTRERYRETESNKTFSRSTNAQKRNTERVINVKVETPWNQADPAESSFGAVYSCEVSDHSNERNNSVSQLSDQTMPQNMQNDINDENCDTTQGILKNVIGNSLSVQRLIANIRNAVATNPNFKRSEHDSAANETLGRNEASDAHVSSSATEPSFGGNNTDDQLSEETVTQSMSHDIQHTHNTTEEDPKGNNHNADVNQTLTCYVLNSGEGVSPSTKQNYVKRNSQNFTSNKTLIHSLPYPAEGVEVVYTVDPVDAEAWLRNNITDCSAQAVGLDIEWKPQFVSKKKGGVENKTAVLQLGVESSCLVLHLGNMKALPQSLRVILTDRKILKVGSGILQDVAKLKRDTGLICKGIVDTQKMAKSVGAKSSQKLGLKALAERFLGINLEKPKAVSRSNWEKYPLTIRQIHYAALDAWIGFKLYQHMKLSSQGQTPIEETLVEDEVDKNPAEIAVCHVCNKKCKGQDALAIHIKIHPQCKCGKFFVSKVSRSHKKNCAALKTVTPKPVDDKVKKNSLEFVPCHVCSRQYGGQEALDSHMKVHAQCKCGRYFMAKVSKSHRKHCPEFNAVTPEADQAAGDNIYHCQACGKKCKSEEQLMKHIREVGHVQCPFCTRLLNGPQCTQHIRRCKHIINGEWKQTQQSG